MLELFASAHTCRLLRIARSYPGTALAKALVQAMAIHTCTQCDRPATTTIPAAEESVCDEHAAEFWQALLRFAVARQRPAASPESEARDWTAA